MYSPTTSNRVAQTFRVLQLIAICTLIRVLLLLLGYIDGWTVLRFSVPIRVWLFGFVSLLSNIVNVSGVNVQFPICQYFGML